MKLDIIASITLAAAILFGFGAAATPAPEQAPAAPRTTPAIHPEFGEVIKTDVQLNSIEKVAFVLQRAANGMLKKMIGHLVVISILGILIMKYGRSAWVHFSKTDISTRGLRVMVALLLPLAYTSHIVVATKDLALNKVPAEDITQWKYGTTAGDKVPQHIEHDVEIPK